MTVELFVRRLIPIVHWKPKREYAMFVLMGQRALLMQIAHPQIARAVARHSSFRSKPAERLRHTFELSMKLFAGTDEEAAEAAARINRSHIPVRGPGYDARDRELGKWVWATLAEGIITGHELFMGPLSNTEKEAVVASYRQRAALLGLGEELPATLAELEAYMDDMIESETVYAGETARELAAFILGPVPASFRPLTGFLARATLPDKLRDQYQLSWSPLGQQAFASLIRPFTNLVIPRVTANLACLSGGTA